MLISLVPEEAQRAVASANPTKRLCEPKEVAEAIAFLASDGASYINGAVLDVNGGIL
jgi:3-oxoacyl-[acyl-carrier protein] reductase